MAQLNKALQAGIKLFNYRTKDSNGFVQTANLINVFERYHDQYQNYSEYQKFDMWSDILRKWFISYLRKLINYRGNKSVRKAKLNLGDYQGYYDELVKYLRYIVGLLQKSKYAFIRGDAAYEYLTDIHGYYMNFISNLNQYVRFARMDGGKIKTAVITNPIPQHWYESRWYQEWMGKPRQYPIDLHYNPKYHDFHY